MGAPLDAGQLPPAQRVVPGQVVVLLQLDPGVLHPVDEVGVVLQAAEPVEHDVGGFERDRRKVVDIAMLLEEKSAIPAVKAQLGYLQAMQAAEFWVGIDIAALEEMRLRLRELVPLLDKTRRHIVFTDFADEIIKL